METVIRAIEVFAAVTGVLYVILEIMQKRAMWVVGILTGAACAFSFTVQGVWASACLNIYYLAVSVMGLRQWKKDSGSIGENDIHLTSLPGKTAAWSAAAFVVGSLVFTQILRAAGDPAPVLDALATVLSAVATWWLAKSYIQHWMLWIVADTLTTAMCLVTGQYLLAIMYLAYIGGAVYGYCHWKKRGVTVA